jgi:hypothetical protein
VLEFDLDLVEVITTSALPLAIDELPSANLVVESGRESLNSFDNIDGQCPNEVPGIFSLLGQVVGQELRNWREMVMVETIKVVAIMAFTRICVRSSG